MIIVIKFKKRIIGICNFSIIIYKFCYNKKSSLVILLLFDKCLEVGFYSAILTLNLAICLKIVNSKKFLLNAEEVV